MVNAAAAALKDSKTPVKQETKPVVDSEKSSPQALGSSSEKVQNGKMEEVKLEEVALDITPEEKVEKVSPAKIEAPKQEESNKENLSSGKKTEKPEAAAE